MKILVLNPPFLKRFSRSQRSPAVTKSGTFYYPIWLAYCVGVLEQDGFQVAFLDAPARDMTRNHVLNHAVAFNPKLIVLDTSTPSIENDMSVAAELKRILPQSFVVLVGTHVSALPDLTLKARDAVDAVARGEYEMTIRDLARMLAGMDSARPDDDDLKSISGLSFRLEDMIVHNPDRKHIDNLDELPWVSRVYKKHLDIRDYYNADALYPMVTLVTSRGCPFRCNFCVYPQTLFGRKYRFRSIADVVDEMAFVRHEFPSVKSFFFEDDTLTAHRGRCLQFAESILERHLNIPWTANSRIDIDITVLKNMKAAGCRELCVGFESGSQIILNSMKKGIHIEHMYRFMKDAREAGIFIHGCFILGFPEETLETVQETINLAIRLEPDTVQFYPVMVYPGTEAYAVYERNGWISAQNFSQWITPKGLHNCVIRNATLDSRELVRLCDKARRQFYLRPRYMLYKLVQALTSFEELIRTTKAARTFFRHVVRGSDI